jgi:type III restriction enzyme
VTRRFSSGPTLQVPVYALFPQALAVARHFLRERVTLRGKADRRDVFLEPYFTWAVETLVSAMVANTSCGEAAELPRFEAHRGPGSTGDVDFWTSRDTRPTEKSHVSAVVADTERWEQSAAFYLEASAAVRCYVKNDHLGFTIPYLWHGERHDYVPDFLARLEENGQDLGTLILEVKGGRDERTAHKEAGARRWVAAINADKSERSCGRWAYGLVHSPTEVPAVLADAGVELRTLSTTSATGMARHDRQVL